MSADTQSVVTIFEHLGFQATRIEHTHFLQDQSSLSKAHEDDSHKAGELWHHSSVHLNSSNTSGYETESESREYFIARDAELDIHS